MQTSLSPKSIAKVSSRLRSAMAGFAKRYPGEVSRRQPVHTVYGGAHLFRADTAVKLGRLAVKSFETYPPDAEVFARILNFPPELAESVHTRVAKKLANEPVEDLRIDFEDGYGTRSDAEEDGHAVAAALNLANGMADETLPPFVGIRIKSFSDETLTRSIRTLDLFLSTLLAATDGVLPSNFVITLPKIVVPEQVGALADLFDEFEPRLGLPAGTLKMEMMIETPQSIISAAGEMAMPRLYEAARGRCTGAHFGAYDYTASCGIAGSYQDILHPACDFARNIMQASFAGTGVWLSDSVTNTMPIGPHRGGDLTRKQIDENTEVVHRAWKLHYGHCRNSLANGFYQGWDLHPAQLPTRYAAVYSFFLEGIDDASDRLRNFIDKAARATLVGDVFDDAATGQGLLNYFLRAINCGAVSEPEALERTDLTLDELRSGSFVRIVQNR